MTSVADPGERDNLADHAHAATCRRISRRGRASAGTSPSWTPRCAQSQRRRRLVDAALKKGKIRAWDFQPFRDASQQYIRNAMDLDDLEAMARFPQGRQPVGPPSGDRRKRTCRFQFDFCSISKGCGA